LLRHLSQPVPELESDELVPVPELESDALVPAP
jgi:hypothetical protein